MNDPRAIRAQREARLQEDRNNSRNRQRGRGSVVHKYDDMGVSATEEGHDAWVEGENKYQTARTDAQNTIKTQEGQLSTWQKQLGTASSQVNAAQNQFNTQQNSYNTASSTYNQFVSKGPDYSSIPSRSTLQSKAWTDARKRFVPVRIVAGSDNHTEGTYYLPKDYAQSYLKQGDLYTNWANGGLYVHVNTRSGRIRGQELHDAMRNAYSASKTNIYREVANQYSGIVNTAKSTINSQFNTVKSQHKGQLDSAYNQLVTNRNQLNTAKSQLSSAQSSFNKSKASVVSSKKYLTDVNTQRNEFKQGVIDDYKARGNTIKSVFGGLNIGRK